MLKHKLIRVTTVPLSLDKLLTGQLGYMHDHNFNVHMVSSWDAKLPLIAEREKSNFSVVNMTRTISPLKDIVSLIKLIKVFKKLKPTIVHTHTPKAGLLGMLASWFVKTPIRLHTVAGLPLMEAKGFKRKILELVESLTYRCASNVYPNSKSLEKFIIDSNFCKPGKTKVLGNGSSNGIDVEFFKLTPKLSVYAKELRSKYNILQSDFIYVYVGRLVKDKGIEELTEAFSNINVENKNIWLLLVGPTETDLDPLSIICMEQIRINSKIIHVGYQNDVRPYLAMSNALVFPSYREGFPNVPMQAGCFELPSIVTNINGSNEIIEHNTNGLIISIKNSTHLQNAMQRLIEDKVLYEKLKSNARRMIIERYEQIYFWSLILQEYNEQLKNHGIIIS